MKKHPYILTVVFLSTLTAVMWFIMYGSTIGAAHAFVVDHLLLLIFFSPFIFAALFVVWFVYRDGRPKHAYEKTSVSKKNKPTRVIALTSLPFCIFFLGLLFALLIQSKMFFFYMMLIGTPLIIGFSAILYLVGRSVDEKMK